MGWVIRGVAICLFAGAAGCAVTGDFASDDPKLVEAPGRFEGRFLAISDADMTATAYVDGVLEPLNGAADELTLVEDGAAMARMPASNSVISWPQVVDVSPDGRFAYVVETRGAPPPGTEAYDSVYTDFPTGTVLSAFAIGETAITPIASLDGLGDNLQSVEVSRRGGLLVIGSETPGAEAVLVALRPDGAPNVVRRFDLAPPYRDDDTEQRVRTLHLSPDGETLAVNVANRRIQFYRVTYAADGLPEAVTPLGAPSADLGSRLAVGKWTSDSRFFVVTDTNWADSTLHMLTQGPGALTTLRPPAGANGTPEIVSRARVGRSPEGFGISPDGTRLATINMERTYLPNWPVLATWQGRRRYSVSLVSLDPETGALDELDRVYKAGILPEDVIFDAGGNNLAVAVFHRRKGEGRNQGYIDYFSIEDDRLASQGVTQPVMRGAHDLVRLP